MTYILTMKDKNILITNIPDNITNPKSIDSALSKFLKDKGYELKDIH